MRVRKMGNNKSSFLFAASCLLAAGNYASAETTNITISLWDKGQDKAMVTNMIVGVKMDMSAATMGVRLSTNSVKAGTVVFDVSNDSKETIHEMLVIPLVDGRQGPPVDEKEAKIDEEGAGDLGEVSELEPGKRGKLKLDLKQGRYLLTCNIPGHYMNGMWSILTVK
jgi:uncharacterized cupredoxin-like copper-binding protein